MKARICSGLFFMVCLFAGWPLRLVSLLASRFLFRFGCHVQKSGLFLGSSWNKEAFLGLLSRRCSSLAITGLHAYPRPVSDREDGVASMGRGLSGLCLHQAGVALYMTGLPP